MLRVFFLQCFLFFIHSLSTGQKASCRIQQFSTEDGMPSNGIKGLQFDERTGFLWLATEAGIVRFNGEDFVTYNSQNMPAIASERIMFITRSHAGEIYISDTKGNIFSIKQSMPVVSWASPGKMNPFYDNYFLWSVSDVFFKKSLPDKDLNRLSPLTFKTASLSDSSCLVYGNGKLYFYSISMKRPELLFPGKKLRSILKIGDQVFLADQNNEVFLFYPGEKSLRRITIVDNNGKSIKVNSGDSRWYWEMGMKTPVLIDGENAYSFRFNQDTVYRRLLFSGIPPDTYIQSVYLSEKNNQLFIGTDSRGLIVVSEFRVQSKKRNPDSPGKRNSYYSQIELDNGSVLTNEGDIIGTGAYPPREIPINGNFSYNISYTGDSLLWYNQQNKNDSNAVLRSYNLKTGETKSFPKIHFGNFVTATNDQVYLVDPFGIGIFDRDSIRYLFRSPPDYFREGLYDFKEIAPGKLAVVSCRGVLGFDVRTRKLDTIFAPAKGCARSLWKYGDYFFIGTYGGGFYIWKNGRAFQMPLDKNKFLLYAHCFVADDYGFCWISTNRGLLKASLTDLIDAYEKKKSQVYYHYIGRNDGMDITEMNGGCTPCALVMRNKTISFPTMDGLVWVNPAESKILLPEGNVYIDEFYAGHQKINADSSGDLEFSSGQRDIRLKLGYSAWCNKENIYLDYKLNNGNWTPVDLETGAFISFNNLQPGNYIIQIRKLNGFGVDNYSYKKISFSINKPWNQRWWFYILVLAVTWALVSAYLKFRTRQYQVSQRKLEKQVADKTRALKEQNEQLEKNNTIKSRLISIISHDIITPLKFLTVAGNNLVDNRKLMPDELQEETIKEMTNTTQELQLLSTNILNWIKYQNENRLMAKEVFNVHELVRQVLSLLVSLAKQKKLELINEVDEDFQVQQYYEPVKILVYNLLTNAIQFTEKGRIVVSAFEKEGKFVLQVADDGVGMSPEQIQRILAEQVVITSANVDNKKGHGLGYLIIKDLVKTMGATIEIKSEKGKGTIVGIYMPLLNGYKGGGELNVLP